jgi:thioredoxin 1
MIRHVFRSMLLAAMLVSSVAQAVEQNFDRASFDALQKAGKPTLVMVHASWCPTCRAQAPVISELLKKPELLAITALRVDFDGQSDVVKSFKVTQQSTLIVFKGGKEVARSVGDTRRESIEALLRRAL